MDLDHKVVVVDALIEQVHGPSPNEAGVAASLFVRSRCEDSSWLNEEVLSYSPFDATVHLVSETGTGQSMYEAARYVGANVGSLASLNDLVLGSTCSENTLAGGGSKPLLDVGRILLLSSRAVYGTAEIDEEGRPIASRESDRMCPTSVYAATKAAQELLLWAGFPGLQKCAVRLQNVYGPGQSLSNPYTGVASIFMAQAMRGEPIFVYSDGEMVRDFVHVNDVTDILVRLLLQETWIHQTLNIGTGVPTSIRKLASMIVDLVSSSSEIVLTGENLDGDIRANFANTELLNSMGMSAEIALHDGLQTLYQWAAGNLPVREDHQHEESLNALRIRGLLA